MDNCNKGGAFAHVLDATVFIQAVTRGWWVRNRTWSPKPQTASDLFLKTKKRELEKKVEDRWSSRLSCQNDWQSDWEAWTADAEKRAISARLAAKIEAEKRKSEPQRLKLLREEFERAAAEAEAEIDYFKELDKLETQRRIEQARANVRRKLAVEQLDPEPPVRKSLELEKTCAEELLVMTVRSNLKGRGCVDGTYNCKFAGGNPRPREIYWRKEKCTLCGGGDIGGAFVSVGTGANWQEACDEVRCVTCAANSSWGGLIPDDLIECPYFAGKLPYM